MAWLVGWWEMHYGIFRRSMDLDNESWSSVDSHGRMDTEGNVILGNSMMLRGMKGCTTSAAVLLCLELDS